MDFQKSVGTLQCKILRYLPNSSFVRNPTVQIGPLHLTGFPDNYSCDFIIFHRFGFYWKHNKPTFHQESRSPKAGKKGNKQYEIDMPNSNLMCFQMQPYFTGPHWGSRWLFWGLHWVCNGLRWVQEAFLIPTCWYW